MDLDHHTVEMEPQERAEALKILGKRQRRVGKVEECHVDIFHLFQRQKRFCPSILEGEETAMSDDDYRLSLTDKVSKDLNRKLVNSIIEQLQEQDTSYQQLPNLLK